MKQEEFENLLANNREVNVIGPLLESIPPLNASLPTVLIDAGVRWKSHFSDYISLGDGDSSTVPLDILYPVEKDLTDFACALDLLANYQTHCVHLYGLLGGRRDHELANYLEVYQFMKKANGLKRAFWYTDTLVTANTFSAGHWALKVDGTFSVFVFDDQSSLIIDGACKYKLSSNDRISPLSGHGISNEGHGEVLFTSQTPFMVFYVKP